MTGCRRLETQKEERFSRIKALPRRFSFSKTVRGFYSSGRSGSAPDRGDRPGALLSPHDRLSRVRPGAPAKGGWRRGCGSGAPRSLWSSARPALFATVSDRRRRAAAGANPAPGCPRPAAGTHRREPPPGWRKLLARRRNKEIRSVVVGMAGRFHALWLPPEVGCLAMGFFPPLLQGRAPYLPRSAHQLS